MDRNSKAGSGIGKFYLEKKEEFLCPEWTVWSQGSWRRTEWKEGVFCDRFWDRFECILLVMSLEWGTHEKGVGKLATTNYVQTSFEFLADCFRGGLASWPFCCRGCGSQLHCHIRSGYCPLVYFVSYSVFNTHQWLPIAKILIGV